MPAAFLLDAFVVLAVPVAVEVADEEDVVVPAAGFDKQHLVAPVGAKAVGNRTTGRP